MRYTDNFMKLYYNIRSAFTDILSEEITEDDILKMYILDVSLQEYFKIKTQEESNE